VADIPVIFCTVLGAALGSFAALAVDRLRRGRSLIAPPSRCETCGTRVRPWDNVPVVSWFVLRGRCRSCKAFIPLHVVLLELAGALGGYAFAAHAFPS
jgi:leader peptidase (prepilin peptidase)/N-methyltransferase